EQLSREDAQLIPITLRSADPNQLVRLATMGEETVIADLKGPLAKLDYVKAELNKNPLVINVPAPLPPGPYPILTAQAIKDAEIFTANGVTVENIHPSSIPIVIDRVDQVEVPVQPPDPNNLSSFS